MNIVGGFKAMIPSLINIGIWCAVGAVIVISFLYLFYNKEKRLRYNIFVTIHSPRMSEGSVEKEFFDKIAKIAESSDIEKKDLEEEIKKLEVTFPLIGKEKYDMGTIVKNKDGTMYFRLKKEKVNLAPPAQNCYVPVAPKGNAVHLIEISDKKYIAINGKFINGKGYLILRPADIDIDSWYVMEMDRAFEKSKKYSFWEQNKAIFMFWGVVVIVLLLLLMMGNYMVKISENLTRQAPSVDTDSIKNAIVDGLKLGGANKAQWG